MSQEKPAPDFWTPILYDVAHALESVEDPEVRIDRVLALMHRFVPYDRCALLEADPVLRRRISVAPEVSIEESNALVNRLQGLVALVSGRALAEVRRVALPKTPAPVHLAVPIIELGDTTGIVFVERAVVPYEESHLAFLSVIAAQVGAYLAAVRAARELRASEARFRGLYESGMIGIAFMDARGAITDANEAFAAMLQRSRSDLRTESANWNSMSPPEYRSHDQAAIREATERGKCVQYEKRFLRKDGRLVTALAGVARLETSDMIVGFVLDISEQKRIEAERATLLKERERDLEFLEMFMAMLGHDLRTPLNAIRMSAEYLRMSEGHQIEEATGRILSSTDRMARMVEQLLDLTGIRLAGGMPIEPRRVNLKDICTRVIEELKAANPQASIHLKVTGDVEGDWDGDRLLQVVSNLLANAVQHVEKAGDITLLVVGTESTVELTTHNAGAIPKDILAVLFEPFRGVRIGGKRDGLGLGLFITEHIVKAHGGSIHVNSSEGGGTIFTVRLPRRAAAPASRADRRPT
jgi:PAS domain S-box-containing protein